MQHRATTDEEPAETMARSMREIAWDCLEQMMQIAKAADVGAAECHWASALHGSCEDYESALIVAPPSTPVPTS